MPVIFVCSQRSCQVEALWGCGTSRSCFFSPMWKFGRAQFKAPKLYTPPGSLSATALLSTCRSRVTSSRMKDSTRTDKGQPDSRHLSSKITVLFSLLCDVWGLAQVTLEIGTLSDWKGEAVFTFSSFCQSFLELCCMVCLLGDAENAMLGYSGRGSSKGRWTREKFSLKEMKT